MKPLHMIPLCDADATSALQYVTRRLEDADVDTQFTPEQTANIERLGGRASDLSTVLGHLTYTKQRTLIPYS